MPTNDFIGFASSGSANVMSQADFVAAVEQTDGVQPGPASSKLANKAWRQGANMAAALGQVIVAQGYDAKDDGNIAALKNAIAGALLLKSGNSSNPMTGNLFGGASSDWFLSMGSDNYILHIRGANGAAKGANLNLYGEGYSITPGAFRLIAAGSGVSTELMGIPGGALTWGGANIPVMDSGTWTPTFQGGSVTFNLSAAQYYKFDKMVYVYAAGTFTSAGTGGLYVAGLPYTPVNESLLGKMRVGTNQMCFPTGTTSGVYFVKADGTGNEQASTINGAAFLISLIYATA